MPALTGLGAPDWDPSARGAILGITRGTTRAHLVRATLEAIAFEVRDVVELLPDVPAPCGVDGGAAANDLLMQLQADTLAMPVERPAELQTTGLGAAFLAGLGTGVWSSTDELAATWRLDATLRARRAVRRTRRPTSGGGGRGACEGMGRRLTQSCQAAAHPAPGGCDTCCQLRLQVHRAEHVVIPCATCLLPLLTFSNRGIVTGSTSSGSASCSRTTPRSGRGRRP